MKNGLEEIVIIIMMYLKRVLLIHFYIYIQELILLKIIFKKCHMMNGLTGIVKKMNLLLLKPLCPWHFVMAAEANEYRG